MNNLAKAALWMGYRNTSDNKFLKPIGYSCLAIEIDTLKFVSYFKADEKIHVWSSSTFDEENSIENYIEMIKCFETSKLHLGFGESNFEFITPEQIVEL